MGAPATHYQSPSVRVVCRCCLSEEDEMTDYLPLDAVTSISVSFSTDDASVGDSSTSSNATLLDCLNGCARIGATLEDAELPLHICLDCCQALEACCEFIRCVQNADKILRRKRLSSPSAPADGRVSVAVSDIAEKAVDLKAPSVDVEGVVEEQLLPIGSLNLQDLIGDSQMEMLDLSSGNKSPNAESTSNDSSSYSRLTTPAKEVNQGLYNLSSQLPGKDISITDIGYQLLQPSVLNSNYETVEGTNVSDEISTISSADMLPNTKDCGRTRAAIDGQTNAIIDTYKFIPPLVKDTNKCKEPPLDSPTILTEDFIITAPRELSQNNCANILDVQSSDITTKYATLLYQGSKYIVNAAQETQREQLKEHKTFIDEPLIATNLPNANKTVSIPTASTDNSASTTYLNRTFLSQFIKFHAKEEKVTAHLCQFCGRSFKRRFHLLKHVHYTHSKDKKKENENCLKRRPNKFDRQRYTRRLLRTTQAEHKLKCDVCGRAFKTPVELSAHAQQHKSVEFQCLTCRTVFSFEFELKYHMRTHISSSSSSSPRSEYHVAESSWSLNASLRTRLQKLNQQKKENRKLVSFSNTKCKPVTKRRLSLASVSTAKSSEEGSPNSPSNANSDEDMPPAPTTTSQSQAFQDDDGANLTTAISVADVMLPQGFQSTDLRNSNTPTSSIASDFASHSSSSSINDKHLHCDSSDQNYLNDFDLNLLDCSDDFWLQMF